MKELTFIDGVYKRKPNRDLLYETDAKDQAVSKGKRGDLRNFDMSEWSNVSIENEDEAELEFNDFSLWPPVRSSEIPTDDMYLAEYILGSVQQVAS